MGFFVCLVLFFIIVAKYQWVSKQRHDLIRSGFYQRGNWTPQVILVGRFRNHKAGLGCYHQRVLNPGDLICDLHFPL